MKAIIPTGGRGTRMRPLTFSQNKHFIPLANKLLIEYPIETIIAAGIKEIAFTYNTGQLENVKSILGDGSKYNVEFTYILQPEPKGLANIFQVCENWVNGDDFVLHLGDNIFTSGIGYLVDYFNKEAPDGLVGITHHPDNRRLGVPIFDKNGRLIQYLEKPDNPPHDYAIPGIYFFSSKVFDCFRGKDKIKPSPRGEYEISAPFQWLIDHNFRVDTKEITGDWLDPGKIDDWIEANSYLLSHQSQDSIESKLGANVHIVSPVSIGKDCQLTNCTIGPNASIGDNCHIHNAQITNSILMKDVKVSNLTKAINKSLIGSHTVIESQDQSYELVLSEMSKIKL